MSAELEEGRYTGNPTRQYTSRPGDPFGLFVARGPIRRKLLILIGSDLGWEHASVSVREDRKRGKSKLPCWAEMDFVKRLVWEDSEAVMQLHVPRDMHVSPGSQFGVEVLHLWRPTDCDIPMPAPSMV